MIFLSMTFFAVSSIAAGVSLVGGLPSAFVVAIVCAVAGMLCFTNRQRFRVAPPLREEDGELLKTVNQDLESAPGIDATGSVEAHHGKE